MNPNTMPLEAETRVLIDRSLDLKQRKRSSAESVLIMSSTRKIATNL